MLKRYLGSLISKFHLKIGNMHLGDAIFLKLRGRIEFSYGQPAYYYIMHSTVASKDLD
jgi:hypothetical protein